MADTAKRFGDYDTDAANNNAAAPDGSPEGGLASALNNTIRELAARAAFNHGDRDIYGTDTGTAAAYQIAITGTNVALDNGFTIRFKATNTNSASPTLRVNSLTAKSIKKGAAVALAAGDIQANQIVTVTYDSALDAWMMVSPVSGSSGYIAPSAGKTWYDDFIGDALDARYSGAVGSDGQCLIAMSATTDAVVITSGDSGVSVAADGASLTLGLVFNGGSASKQITMETRLSIDTASSVIAFVGLTDTLATTTLELPFTATNAAVAADAYGFFVNTAVSGGWACVGVAGGSVKTADTNVATLTTSTITLKIFAFNGDVSFYVDGALVGGIEDAAGNLNLTPCIVIRSLTTATRAFTVDYLYVNQEGR